MTREFIFDTLRTIFVEVRGCEKEKCTLEATIFGDLDCESIDFLEVSFHMEEAFGVPYEIHVFGEIMSSILNAFAADEILYDCRRLREEICLDVPDDLPGLDPLDKDRVFSVIQGLITVDHLVNFVERRLAERIASTQAST